MAYSCFLRLNCTPKELQQTREWKYGKISEAEAMIVVFSVHTNTHVGKKIKGDWATGWKGKVLEDAIAEANSLFPGLAKSTRSLSRKKRRQSLENSKKTNQSSSKRDADDKDQSQAKRQKMSFEVSIPDGVEPGDDFVAAIQIGDASKKVTLTAPEQRSKIVQFEVALVEEDVRFVGYRTEGADLIGWDEEDDLLPLSSYKSKGGLAAMAQEKL